jgi:hypothetical protein
MQQHFGGRSLYKLQLQIWHFDSGAGAKAVIKVKFALGKATGGGKVQFYS